MARLNKKNPRSLIWPDKNIFIYKKSDVSKVEKIQYNYYGRSFGQAERAEEYLIGTDAKFNFIS